MVALGLLALVVLALAWARERGKRLRAERALEKESAGHDEALRVAMAFQSVAQKARKRWTDTVDTMRKLRNECDDLRDENGRLLSELEKLREPVCRRMPADYNKQLTPEEIHQQELLNVLNYDGTEAGQLGFDE